MTAPRAIFVAGTDTDVGKTLVTAALLRVLRGRGVDAGAWKPVQSGCLPGEPDADSHVLKHAGNLPESETEICPRSYRAALAPLLAARREGRTLDLDAIAAEVPAVLARHDLTLIEGAGGLLVPMGPDWLLVDLIARLGCPTLLVARAGLGTVNHTLLSLACLRARAIPVVGVVMNGFTALPVTDDLDPQHANPDLITSWGGVPVLARIPRVAAPTPLARAQAAADFLDRPGLVSHFVPCPPIAETRGLLADCDLRFEHDRNERD